MAHSSNHLQHNTSCRHITSWPFSEIDHSAIDGSCLRNVSFLLLYSPFFVGGGVFSSCVCVCVCVCVCGCVCVCVCGRVRHRRCFAELPFILCHYTTCIYCSFSEENWSERLLYFDTFLFHYTLHVCVVVLARAYCKSRYYPKIFSLAYSRSTNQSINQSVLSLRWLS